MKKHHTIEVTTGNSHLCKEIMDNIDTGKCRGCQRVVYDVVSMNNEIRAKMNDYGFKAAAATYTHIF